MHIGYIGLGKMGHNMVARLVEKGHSVTAYDPDAAARAHAQEVGAQVVERVAAVADTLPPDGQRTLWLMVPHTAVDAVIDDVLPTLRRGDVIIDGGNSYFKDTVRRAQMLAEHDIAMLDIGTSGGPAGARSGACMMVGGAREVYASHKDLIHDLSAPDAYGYMGRHGAGHFVKMVHNGIEYGMMQAIAEGFAVMKASDFAIDLTEAARVYNHQSVIASRLTQWLEDAYRAHGEDLADISGKVAHSGEGLWTVETAHALGIPVPIIAGSLQFREQSQQAPSYTGQVVSALRGQFGGHPVSKEE